jgi:hypothetical protein
MDLPPHLKRCVAPEEELLAELQWPWHSTARPVFRCGLGAVRCTRRPKGTTRARTRLGQRLLQSTETSDSGSVFNPWPRLQALGSVMCSQLVPTRTTRCKHVQSSTRQMLDVVEAASSHVNHSWRFKECEDIASFRACKRSHTPCRAGCSSALHRPLPSSMNYGHFTSMGGGMTLTTQMDNIQKRCTCCWRKQAFRFEAGFTMLCCTECW